MSGGHAWTQAEQGSSSYSSSVVPKDLGRVGFDADARAVAKAIVSVLEEEGVGDAVQERIIAAIERLPSRRRSASRENQVPVFVQGDSLQPLTLDRLEVRAPLGYIDLASGRRSRELGSDFNQHLISAAALPMPGIPIPT